MTAAVRFKLCLSSSRHSWRSFNTAPASIITLY
jgi:hypothetical protein